MQMWIPALSVGILAAALIQGAGIQTGAEVRNRKGQTMSGVSETERTDLANRVSHTSAYTADLILRPQSTVERLPAPFLGHGAIYRVTFIAPSGPMAFTVGYGDSEAPILLQMNPDGFFAVVGKAHLSLGSPDSKIAYAVTFLEATRDFRRGFQMLHKASDIELIAKPTPEERARYAELQSKYNTFIRAPHVSDTSPSEVTVFALSGQNLIEITLNLSADGRWKRSDKVLEEDLPIGFAK